MQLRALGDVHVMPVPGYSLPADAATNFEPKALAAHVLSAAENTAAQPRPVLLVGHSAGCQIAAEVAAQFPAGVARLVLICPTTDPRARGWLALALRWLRTAVREPISLLPALGRSYRMVGLPNMARAIAAARRHDLESALARVHCAVLVVRGRADCIAPQDWVDRLATSQRADARNIDGAHMLV